MLGHESEYDSQFWREDGDGDDYDRCLHMELANNVGKNVRIATQYGEFLYGRIVGVKEDAVYLVDSRGDRIMCRLVMICYCKIRQKNIARKRKKTQRKTTRKP